jgi:hypothetical protein
MSVPPEAEQRVGPPITVSGSGESDAGLDVLAVPYTGSRCEAEPQAERSEYESLVVVTEHNEIASEPSFRYTFSPPLPEARPYLVCAWILGISGGVVAGPVEGVVKVHPPVVQRFNLTTEGPLVAGQPFQVKVSAQTNQELKISASIRPASGLGCALDLKVEKERPQQTQVVIESDLPGGAANLTETAKVESPGSYLLCAWIEGPEEQEIDGVQSVLLNIAAPPTPPPPQREPTTTTPSPQPSPPVGSAPHGHRGHKVNRGRKVKRGHRRKARRRKRHHRRRPPRANHRRIRRRRVGRLGRAASSVPRLLVTAVGSPRSRGGFQVRPRTIRFGADGGTGFVHLRWRRWTANRASGSGYFYLDDCKPNCAGAS